MKNPELAVADPAGATEMITPAPPRVPELNCIDTDPVEALGLEVATAYVHEEALLPLGAIDPFQSMTPVKLVPHVIGLEYGCMNVMTHAFATPVVMLIVWGAFPEPTSEYVPLLSMTPEVVLVPMRLTELPRMMLAKLPVRLITTVFEPLEGLSKYQTRIVLSGEVATVVIETPL